MGAISLNELVLARLGGTGIGASAWLVGASWSNCGCGSGSSTVKGVDGRLDGGSGQGFEVIVDLVDYARAFQD